MAELTPMDEQLLAEASAIADRNGHAVVGTEYVLLAMTRQSDDSFARRLLDELGATDALCRRLEDEIGSG
jgi:ATP-dependent Clp protease ATP-binding subunit ClpA